MFVRNRISLLLIIFILTVHGNQDDLFETEILTATSEGECWASRGVPVTKCTDCSELDYRRSGHVKLYKTSEGKLIAFNSGYLIFSKTDSTISRNFSVQVKSALDDGEEVYMRFHKESEDWATGKYFRKRNQTVDTSVNCLYIKDFKCTQTAVIRSENDYERFEKLGCKELKGDLVISGFLFRSSKNYSAFENLENISGRLIIASSVGKVHLVFSSLVSIYREAVADPVLQITGNRLNGVSFPKLKPFRSLKKPSRSIVFGENVQFDDALSLMPIQWQNTWLDTSYLKVVEVKTVLKKKRKQKRLKIVEQEAWMTEKYFKEHKIPYQVISIYRSFFPGYRILYFSISVVHLIVAAALCIRRFKSKKELQSERSEDNDLGEESHASHVESEFSENESNASITSGRSTHFV